MIRRTRVKRAMRPRLRSVQAEGLPVEHDRELVCANCGAIFPEYLARCPECGSEEWKEFVEVNPYTRLPLEQFLKICGHSLWLVGTIGCLVLFWQTDGADQALNMLYIYGGILVLVCSLLMSAAYFGISELLSRTLRMQRRLCAFHETYRKRHNINRQNRKSAGNDKHHAHHWLKGEHDQQNSKESA